MSDIYSIFTKITKVEESIQRICTGGVGNEAIFTNVSHGWFVTFEGSYESLYFGDTKPSFTVGKRVKITFEEVEE